MVAEHPYRAAPPYRRWRAAVAEVAPDAVDPVIAMPFRLAPATRVANAGSCFAQHIARALPGIGLDFLVTETAHPLLPPELAEQFGYGIYTARTGNIYTARQLLQLWQRAHGEHTPADDIWEDDGKFFDPFRPAIQPGGFPTAREYAADRARHFAAIREAFATMDVLVFTLGLTECWEDRTDGTVYPVCPGTIAGRFDPARHRLRNQDVDEVVGDLAAFIERVRRNNPAFRLILTVSPVPLAATACDRHVLTATTYAKSVLRVAAERLAADPAIAYFPAYEIVTGAFARGRYFAADLRSVTPAGVDHVMRLFRRHALERPDAVAPRPAPAPDAHFATLAAAVAVLCEEEALDTTP